MVKGLFLASDVHWALVCLIGVAVVFVGLAVIIGLVELMNLVTTRTGSKKKATAPAPAPAASAPAQVTDGVIENRDEIVAAVCAAVAEENGTDISAIRVVSFKKI
ncbi:MAG: OadG family protein [Clostridia bacterium]|nr:OadG family protein [Clostridia bacterium]